MFEEVTHGTKTKDEEDPIKEAKMKQIVKKKK